MGQYRSALLKELDALAAQAETTASAEMLDMLGRIDPFASEQQNQWFERLCRARAMQQPQPVPSGASIVWRCDLVKAVAELIQLRAYRGHIKAERARGQQAGELTNAAHDVLAERRRQVEAEGWTPEHDDQHRESSMSYAAACYALEGTPAARAKTVIIERLWEWTGWSWFAWWKPKSRRQNLVRATALLLAEIERIDRAKEGGAVGDVKGDAS
jgi:hypothetical protein